MFVIYEYNNNSSGIAIEWRCGVVTFRYQRNREKQINIEVLSEEFVVRTMWRSRNFEG